VERFPSETRDRSYPVTVKDLMCPKCNVNLAFHEIKIDIYPYLHADLFLFCVMCKATFTFGVPADHHAGMAQYVMSTDYEAAGRAFTKTPAPSCPLHNQPMQPTKYIDYNPIKDTILQFKCPTCYLVKNVLIAPPQYTDTQAEPAVLDRLRRLNYIE